jgi:metal-responsive CopG/Arc/MetJ family transcriptional regulator
MKIAVSIPDPIFAKAEGLAKHLKLSRSKIYARALDEFVENHASESVTDAMNAAIDANDDLADNFVRESSRRILRSVEW